MNKIPSDYDAVIVTAHSLFKKKAYDYGTNWRVLRPISMLDQLFIKASRIRTIDETGVQKVNGVGNSISDEFIAIVNYGSMAVIQFTKGAVDEPDIEVDEAIRLYEESLRLAQNGMADGSIVTIDLFQKVCVSTLNDLILQNIVILKKMVKEGNLGDEAIKKLLEIVNYAIFALMMLMPKEVKK